MKKGEDSPNLDDQNKNLGNEESLKIIKDLQQKYEELSKKLVETRQSPATAGGVTPSDILSLVDAVTNKTKKELNYQEGIFLEQVPEDDYLPQEQWVRFCVPSVGYVIVDDVRKGHVVKLPYGKPSIFFKFLLLNIKQTGKNTITNPVASYTSMSKAEVAWIRGHSKFGTLIFEETGAASSSDVEKALTIGRILENINSMDFHVVVAEATKNYGLPFNQNPEEMKKHLAFAMYERQVKEQEKFSHEMAEQAWKNERMLAGK